LKYFEYGETEMDYLRKKDKKLGVVIDQFGIIKRRVNPDIFSSLVESIIAQQISTKAANTVFGRLQELCDMDFRKLNALPVEDIQKCGMSMRKASYVKNIAEAAASGNINFDALHEKSDDETISALTAINGIGRWTVEMLLIFSLMRPNIVSYGDLAVRRGMIRLYGLKELPKEKFLRYAKRYSPYGTVAAFYLWHISNPEVEIKAAR
jgi:3-methyladenine DNA glycosylase/8-oxoguanine DNA glycosylase